VKGQNQEHIAVTFKKPVSGTSGYFGNPEGAL